MRIAALALLLPFAALAAIPAHADTILTPVSGYIYLATPESGTDGPVASTQTLTDATGTVSGASQLGTDPTVQGSFSATGLPSFSNPYGLPIGYDSESVLFYEFAVNGPAGQTVGVNFSSIGDALVSALGSGYSLNATAYLSVSGPGIALSATACAGDASQVSDPCGSVSGPASNSFDISQVLNVATDTAYTVNIYTSDSIEGPARGIARSYSASSSVDPTITLDTTDPAYSLEFSPGLLPSPTPEPSGLLLLGTGLATSVGLIRRRFVQGWSD